MSRLQEWLRDLFSRPEVEPFIAEEDPFVQRAHEVIEESRERRRQRKQQRSDAWDHRNAIERELLGSGKR